MTRDLWICLIASAVLLGFGAHVVRDYFHKPTVLPITESVTITRTQTPRYAADFVFSRSEDTGIAVYRPMDFQINGESVAHVSRRDGTLIYVVGGKETTRAAFYEFMDAWLRKNAGLWTPPQ